MLGMHPALPALSRNIPASIGSSDVNEDSAHDALTEISDAILGRKRGEA